MHTCTKGSGYPHHTHKTNIHVVCCEFNITIITDTNKISVIANTATLIKWLLLTCDVVTVVVTVIVAVVVAAQ